MLPYHDEVSSRPLAAGATIATVKKSSKYERKKQRISEAKSIIASLERRIAELETVSCRTQLSLDALRMILMQENSREKLRLQVMPQGIKAMDELSTTVLQMKLATLPRSPDTFNNESQWASIHKLPWKNPDWKDSLRFATPDQVRHYHRCFVFEMRDSLTQMSRLDMSDEVRAGLMRNALELLGGITSLSRFLLNFNPLALLSNIGRNLETGVFNDQDEQFSMSLAAFTLNFISPVNLEKLRGGFKVYEEQLAKVQKKKAILSSLLNYHLKFSSSSPSREDTLLYLVNLSTLSRDVQNLVLGIKNWPKMHHLILSDTFLTSLPSSPEQKLNESLSKLVEEVEVYVGSTNAVDLILACLERSVQKEVAVRSLLIQVAVETMAPLVVANIYLRAYPYIIELPKLIADCLCLHDSNKLKKL